MPTRTDAETRTRRLGPAAVVTCCMVLVFACRTSTGQVVGADRLPAGVTMAVYAGTSAVTISAPRQIRHEDYCQCTDCPGEPKCCCRAPAPLRPLAALICSGKNGTDSVTSLLSPDSVSPIALAPAILPFWPTPRAYARCCDDAPYLRDLQRPDPPPRSV